MLTHLLRIRTHGTSYAIATGFFPSDIAQDVIKLYSFVRVPDDIVDIVPAGMKIEAHYKIALTTLQELEQQRLLALDNQHTEDKEWGQYVSLFKKRNIQREYSTAFFKAMKDDCTVSRYDSYKQLQGYMYGSASVVGLMMCDIVGLDTDDRKQTLTYARELGDAMQLTNFLRDIKEDYNKINRIYMPSEMLEQYGLSHEDIIQGVSSGYTSFSPEKQKKRVRFMKSMIKKCRTMYRSSERGIEQLSPDARQAVRLASRLYEGILNKIESVNYNVFDYSCRTTLRDKCKILYHAR